jgi:CRP-like cAMP-binding protein
MCGAAGDFGRASYPYTVTALTDASVVGVPAAAFERWLAADAGAACRVAGILSRRLLETAQLRAINAERAPLRLRLTLHWLSRKIGPRIPATRALLADLTGLRAETCSRVLSGLRRRGALRVSPGLVHILRPEALAGSSIRS